MRTILISVFLIALISTGVVSPNSVGTNGSSPFWNLVPILRDSADVDSTDEVEPVVEETQDSVTMDIFVGFFSPYATLSSEFDGSSAEREDAHDIMVPDIHGESGWGVTVGFREVRNETASIIAEVSYYRAQHDYSWRGENGKAVLSGVGGTFVGSYSKYTIQPLFFLGASILQLRLDYGAIDNLGNRKRTVYSGVATNTGVGFNLTVSRHLWFSSRIAYRRYWFYSIELGEDFHSIENRKPDGLWLTVGLYSGVGVK
ncbi:MAG: hypothetical protein KOO62_10465 [candidate division Zixibacteria bacterium]|nr:hypothetical protein [candidate division Zixibacteria bacterium]